jgi:hypothetical protein
MVPRSRLLKSGAYRILQPNIINGVSYRYIAGSAVSNNIKTRFVDITYSAMGDYNDINLYKRRIAPAKEAPFRISVALSIGDKNLIDIKYWSDEKENTATSLTAGDDNLIDVIVDDLDDISIGSRNVLLGSFDTMNDGVEIGDDNVLINFSTEISEGTEIVGMPRESEMMYETKVAEYAGMGQDYIEVVDPSMIMFGTEVIFGSSGAAFVRRVVTAVNNNRVYFDEPLLSRESTFPGAEVFNEYYEKLDAFETTLSEDALHGSKRIFMSDSASLHLRDIVIGGTFSTKIFFVRDEDNMAIIKDMLDQDYEEGTTIYSPGVNKYAAWSIVGEKDPNIPNRLLFDGENNAYIGRSCTVGQDEYTIVGFGRGYIDLSVDIAGTQLACSFDELDDREYGLMVSSIVSADTTGISTVIPVDDTTGFFIGQPVAIDGFSRKPEIVSKTDSEIVLSTPMVEQNISNSFYIGSMKLGNGAAEARQLIANASQDIHTYIFGD